MSSTKDHMRGLYEGIILWVLEIYDQFIAIHTCHADICDVYVNGIIISKQVLRFSRSHTLSSLFEISLHQTS